MSASLPTKASRWERLGLTRQILVPALACIALAVGAVEYTAASINASNSGVRIERQIDTSLAVFRGLLAPLGTEWSMGEGGLRLGNTPIAGQNGIPDRLNEITGDSVATVFQGDERIATSVRKDDGTRAIGTRLPSGPVRDAVLGQGATFRGEAVILNRRHATIYEPIRDRSGSTIGILFVGVDLEKITEADHRAQLTALAVGLAVLLLGGFVLWWIVRKATQPLDTLAEAMRRIGEGQLETEVPSTSRKDRIGIMARTLVDLRDEAAAAKQAALASNAEKQTAERQRAVEIKAVAKRLQDAIGGASIRISEAVGHLQGAANAIGASADSTSSRADAAEAGASQAAANVQTVAAAAEELAASVQEIGRQVSQASDVAKRAVDSARRTDTVVQGLADTGRRIGAVVGLINQIAGQTSLLALNATIEAARAGEAGRGFAVVASEVKALAGQTSKATEEIASQVNAMQSAISQAVVAINDIAAVVSEIDRINAAIATAVSEQGAATREIARSVQDAAAGTGDVSSNVTRVLEDAQATSTAVADLRSVSSELASGSDAMRKALDENLTKIVSG